MTQRRQRAEALRHFVWWDEPSATSKRRQRATCGRWVSLRDVVKQDDDVTCPDCRRMVADRDALHIGDDEQTERTEP